jgi:hypothetical protein
MFAKKITQIKKLQEKIPEIEKRVKYLTQQVEKHVNKRLKERYPGIHFNWCGDMAGGCMTNKWTPEVFFFSVNDCEWDGKDWYKFVFVGGDSFDTWEKVESPISTREFKKFLKELSSELGMPVTFGPSLSIRCWQERIGMDDDY